VVFSFAITLILNNIPQKAYAASIYWVGGAVGDENNWNNANNWASSSGGVGGTAGIPTASDAVIFNSAKSANCTLSGAGEAASITSSGYAGTISLGSNTLTVSGDVNYEVGSFDLGSGNLNVTGMLDFYTASVTPGTSTITLSGAANSEIWGGNNTFNNITISSRKSIPYSSSGKSSFKVAGILNVADTKNLDFNLGVNVTFLKGASLNLNTSGSLSRASASSITLEDPTATTVPTAGTISVDTYFDAKTQDIFVQGRAYSGLYIRNASAGTSYTATLGTANSQTITSGSMIMYANGTGDLTINGTTYNPTVTLTNYGGYRYYLDFQGTGSGTEILNAGSGTWTVGSSDVDLRGGILNAGTSSFIFNREYSLYNQTVYSGGNTFNNITNANTDTHGTDAGLCFLDSVTATTYTYTSPVGTYRTQFTPGITATFTNFNVSGQAGKLAVFKPYGSSASWNLNVTNQPTVSYVDVSYSNAAGGAAIIAADGTSTDSGNNANWDFGKRYWVASSPGNWSNAANWAYSSGGTGGVALPTTTTQVYFNSSANNNCTINQSIDVVSITVDAAYTATIDAASASMNVSGNFDLGGSTFTPGSSTLILDGAAGQTLTANGKTFSTITITNANAAGVTTSGSITTGTLNAITPSTKIKFDNTATFTVSSTFNVGGSGAGRVYLYSNSDGNQWDLVIPADTSKTYLDVKDSVVNHNVTCSQSADSGNNSVNWVFDFLLTENLNGYWKLDDDYSDTSANANTGTNTGSTITAQGVMAAPGKNMAQAGASFDGNDYVSMGDPANGSLDFGTGSLSAGAWFKTTMGAGSTGRLISKGHWGWTAGYALSIADGKVEFGVGGGTQIRSTLFNTSSTFNDNNWHYAVGVHDVGTQTAKIYVDGVLQNITQVAGTCGTASSNSLNFSGCTFLNASNTTVFTLGRSAAGAGLYTGSMDEPRVYTRPLTTTDIAKLYKNAYVGTGNWTTAANWPTTQQPAQEGSAWIESGTVTLDAPQQVKNFQMLGGTMDFGSSTLTTGGNVSFAGGTTTAGTGTLALNGTAGQTLIGDGQPIYNLTITNAHADGVTFSGDIIISGTLTDTTASSKLKFGANSTYTVNNITLSGQAVGTMVALTSTTPGTKWKLNVSGTQSINYTSATDSDATGGNIISANSGTNADGTGNLNWNFSGGIIISGRVYTADDKSTDIGANKTVALSVNGGAKTTVETGSNGSFSFNPSIGSNFTVSLFLDDETEKGSLFTIAVDSNTNITGLEMYSGKIVLRHENAGPITNTALATAITCADSDLKVTVASNNASFDGALQTRIDSGKTYSPSIGTAASGAMNIDGTITMGSYGLSVDGDFDVSDGTFTTATNTITFVGSTDTSWRPGSNTYNNVTINKSNGVKVTLNVNPTLNGSLTLTNGLIDGEATVKGGYAIGTGFDGGTLAVTLSGTSDQTVTLSSGTTPSGDITTTNSGNTNFTGSGRLHDINLNAGTMNFAGSFTYTFIGGSTVLTQSGTTINLGGSDSNLVTLRSSNTTPWVLDIDAGGSYTAGYVDVAYSNASPSTIIYSSNSVDSLNNTNWDFLTTNGRYWIATSDGDWTDNSNWSTSSGGVGGAPYPTATETAVFDSAAAGNCNINADISVSAINNTEYDGTLDATTHNISIENNLVFKSGTINLGSDTWTISGTVDLSGSTLNSQSSNLVLDGDDHSLVVSNQALNDLTIRNASSALHTITMTGNLDLVNLYVASNSTGSSVFDASVSNPNINLSGNIDYTGTGAGSEEIKLGSGTWTTTGNIDLRNGTLSAGTSTVIINGNDKLIYGNSQSFNNITINQNTEVPYIYNGTSDFKANGAITIPTGKTLTINLGVTITLNKGSRLLLDGQIYAPGGGGITAVDSDANTIGSSGTIGAPITYQASTQNVIVTARTYGSSVIISNSSSSNLTATLGTAPGQTFSIDGSFPFYANSTGNLTIEASTYNPTVSTTNYGGYRRYFGFMGTGSGSETLKAGSGTWTIGASDVDFRNGTLNAGTSTFVFNRDYSLWSQVVYSGTNTFYKITNANLDWHGSNAGLSFMDSVTANTFTYTTPTGSYKTQFAPGITATFTNFNVTGQSNKKLIFMPYGTSAKWYLKVTNQPTVSYVTPSYSDASPGASIIAYNGTNTDGGSNTNWLFSAPTPTPVPTATPEPTAPPAEPTATPEPTAPPVVVTATPKPTEIPATATPAPEITATPEVAHIVDGVDDDGILIIDKNKKIEGKGEPGAKVEVIVGGQVFETVIKNNGTWKINTKLPDGEYTATIKVTNKDGSVEQETLQVKVLSSSGATDFFTNRNIAILSILASLMMALFLFLIFKRRKKDKEEKSK